MAKNRKGFSMRMRKHFVLQMTSCCFHFLVPCCLLVGALLRPCLLCRACKNCALTRNKFITYRIIGMF